MKKIFFFVIILTIVFGCERSEKDTTEEFYSKVKSKNFDQYLGFSTFRRISHISFYFTDSNDSSVAIEFRINDTTKQLHQLEIFNDREKNIYSIAKNISKDSAEIHFVRSVKYLWKNMQELQVFKIDSDPHLGDFVIFDLRSHYKFIYYPQGGTIWHGYWKRTIRDAKHLGGAWYYYYNKSMPDG